MRDKIQKIVVEAVAGTKDLTKAIDELFILYDVSVSFRREVQEIIYSSMEDNEIINELHKLDDEL